MFERVYIVETVYSYSNSRYNRALLLFRLIITNKIMSLKNIFNDMIILFVMIKIFFQLKKLYKLKCI